MTINRNNYESIFLLAVDNELSALERNVLDEFLKINSDLQHEFSLLQYSIVSAEEIVFKGKMNLLKPELTSLELEAKILLFIDNELDEAGSNYLKLESVSNEKLSLSINAFLQTKLIPEPNIIFAKKQLLYRKEGNKVIPFGWLKYAAAAVFIGFGIWGVLKYIPLSSNVLVNPLAQKTSIPTNSNNANDEGSITQITPRIKLPMTVKSIAEDIENISKKTENKTVVTGDKQPGLGVYESLAIVDENSKINNNLLKINKEKTIEISDLDKATTIDTFNEYSNSEKNKLNNPQNNVYATSFSENNQENKEDHFSFTKEEDEPKKSKLSSFLRKAKRVLERNTKMKASNENLKVANFEFATQ